MKMIKYLFYILLLVSLINFNISLEALKARAVPMLYRNEPGMAPEWLVLLGHDRSAPKYFSDFSQDSTTKVTAQLITQILSTQTNNVLNASNANATGTPLIITSSGDTVYFVPINDPLILDKLNTVGITNNIYKDAFALVKATDIINTPAEILISVPFLGINANISRGIRLMLRANLRAILSQLPSGGPSAGGGGGVPGVGPGAGPNITPVGTPGKNPIPGTSGPLGTRLTDSKFWGGGTKGYYIPNAIYFYNSTEPYGEFANTYNGFPVALVNFPGRPTTSIGLITTIIGVSPSAYISPPDFGKPIDFTTQIQWRTTEHFFQGQKFIQYPTIEDNVIAQPTGRNAADYGREQSKIKNPRTDKPMFVRPDWFEINTEVMLIAVRAKFKTYPSLKALLLGTDRNIIVENAGKDDPYWGAGVDGLGENMLGQVLMHLRRELQEGKDIDFVKKTAQAWIDELSAPPGSGFAKEANDIISEINTSNLLTELNKVETFLNASNFISAWNFFTNNFEPRFFQPIYIKYDTLLKKPEAQLPTNATIVQALKDAMAPIIILRTKVETTLSETQKAFTKEANDIISDSKNLLAILQNIDKLLKESKLFEVWTKYKKDFVPIFKQLYTKYETFIKKPETQLPIYTAIVQDLINKMTPIVNLRSEILTEYNKQVEEKNRKGLISLKSQLMSLNARLVAIKA